MVHPDMYEDEVGKFVVEEQNELEATLEYLLEIYTDEDTIPGVKLEDFSKHLNVIKAGIESSHKTFDCVQALYRILSLEPEDGKSWRAAKMAAVDVANSVFETVATQLPMQDNFGQKMFFDFLLQLYRLSPQVSDKLQKILSEKREIILENIRYKEDDELSPDEREKEAKGITRERKIKFWARTAAYYCTDADSGSSKSVMEAMLSLSNRFPEIRDAFMGNLYAMSNPLIKKIAEDHISGIFESHQLQRPGQWERNVGEKIESISKNIAKNLSTLRELISISSELPSYLQQENGITNFGRYPVEVLMDMQEQDESGSEIPYVLAVFPRVDWNGAFYIEEVLRQLSQQLSKLGYRLIIIECGSLREVILRTAKLKAKFGLPSASVVAGHGEIKSIQLSEHERVSAEMLFEGRMGNILRRIIKRVFHRLFSVVFISCTVGKDGAIGQQISDEYGLRVVACDEASNVESISAEVVDGGLELGATYAAGNSVVFTKGQKMNGKEEL
jgi:hypothetical protein